MRWRLALALALALAFLAAGCQAPGPAPMAAETGRIDGAVVGPLLSPYGNVTVHLEGLGWTATTTPRGGFSFVGVPAGTHTLSVEVAGTPGDREAVTVAAGGVARVILQVHPAPIAEPYVASLRDHGRASLAMPGAACVGCAWETTLPERPDRAVLEAAWTGATDGRVIVELWGDGLLATLEVPGDGAPHATEAEPAALPGAGGRLRVTARFSDDFVPTPDFRMESLLHLHYHTA